MSTAQFKQARRQAIITQEWIASWHIYWHSPKNSKDTIQVTETDDYTMITEYKDFTHFDAENIIVNVIDIQKQADNTVIITVKPSNQSRADHMMCIASGKSREAVHAVQIAKKSFLNFCKIPKNQN